MILHKQENTQKEEALNPAENQHPTPKTTCYISWLKWASSQNILCTFSQRRGSDLTNSGIHLQYGSLLILVTDLLSRQN